MEHKTHYIGRCNVHAIFVGGGTPSLLSPRQIELLGETISRSFDLHELKEFRRSEVEVESASPEKLRAMRDIGVNRISFGAQTLSQEYRALFALDAAREQIVDAAALLNSMFPYTNADLLFGMAGQTLDQLHSDLTAVVSLQTTTIDVYPINNLVASHSMHREIARAGLSYWPATTRLQFRRYIDQFFRDRGYAPTSGYGFALADKTCLDLAGPVQNSPKFLYQDIFYGYHDDEIIPYGSSTHGHIQGFNMYNIPNRQSYINELLDNRALPHSSFGPLAAVERGIVCFPFRGTLEKSRVPWDEVPDETLAALQQALDEKLIVDSGTRYELTEAGLLFYVNLMYYLMPRPGKEWISSQIERLQSERGTCGDADLIPMIQ